MSQIKCHTLKCWPDFYGDVVGGKKTFEYRKNDRDFRVGDDLPLREYLPAIDAYTG